MVRSYLRYDLCAQFGQGISPDVPAISFKGPNHIDLAAIAISDAIKVCELSTGRTLIFWNPSTKASRITALDIFLTDEVLVAGYADGTVRLWSIKDIDFDLDNATHIEPRIVLSAHRSLVTALHCGRPADGDTAAGVLISGSAAGEVIIWDVTSKTPVHRIQAHVNGITGICMFTRAEVLYVIAGSVDGHMRVFSAESGVCLQTIPGATNVSELRADPAGRYCVARTQKSHVLYTVAEIEGEENNFCQLVGSFTGHGVFHREASFDVTSHGKDSFLAVGNQHSEVNIYKFRTMQEARKHCKKRMKRMQKYAAQKQNASAPEKAEVEEPSATLVPEDFLSLVASGSRDKPTLAVSFSKTGSSKHAANNSNVAFSLVATTANHKMEFIRAVQRNLNVGIKRKRLESASKKRKLQYDLELFSTVPPGGHAGHVNATAVCQGDDSLMSADRNEAKVWNIEEQRCTVTVKAKGSITCCSFLTYDGSHGVLGFKNGKLMIFDTNSGLVGQVVDSAHSKAVKGFWCDSEDVDTKLVSCGSDGAVRYWNVSGDADPKVSLSGEFKFKDEVSCISVEPNEHSTLCAALLDCTVRCVDLRSNKEKLSLYGHKLPIIGMDISTDGRLLVTSSGDRTVKVWGLQFGDCRRSFNCGESPVRCIVFEPKSHLFFTGSTDGSIQYWDGDRLQFIVPLNGHLRSVRHLNVSSNGKIFVSSGEDRTFRVWRRTDEQVFLEEEQEERLAAALEMGGLDAKAGKEATSAAARVYSEFDLLMKTIELCNPDVMEAETRTGLNELQLLGMEPHEYVCKALRKVPYATMQTEIASITANDAAFLADCIQTAFQSKKIDIISAGTYASTAILLSKNFGMNLMQRMNGRKLIRNLYRESKAALTEAKDALGFCQAALRMCEEAAKFK